MLLADAQGYKELSQKSLLEKIKSGDCKRFNKGTEVCQLDTALEGYVVQIRPKGESEVYWVRAEALGYLIGAEPSPCEPPNEPLRYAVPENQGINYQDSRLIVTGIALDNKKGQSFVIIKGEVRKIGDKVTLSEAEGKAEEAEIISITKDTVGLKYKNRTIDFRVGEEVKFK